MAFSWRARDDAHSPEPEGLPWKDYAPPEAEAAERVIQYLRESEVMPPAPHQSESIRPDIRPPSATEANRLDDIATLVRLLTYGEMMDLAAALWKMRPEGKEVTEQELPGMLHRWSTK